jgi:hypothetical protein
VRERPDAPVLGNPPMSDVDTIEAQMTACPLRGERGRFMAR